MANRFRGQHKNIDGIQYNIYIDDADYSGSVTDFYLSGEGYQLRYLGQNKNISNPILPSELTFDMVADSTNRTAIRNLIADLVTAKEKRFKVKVTKGDTSEGLFWYGLLLPDISSYPDKENFSFKVRAVCGLGILNSIEYNDVGVTYTGDTTLLTHILNCINKISTLDFFVTTGTALITSANWFDTNHTTAANKDPLSHTRFDHKAIRESDSKGNVKYRSCLEVLKIVLQLMYCRIYLMNGVWIIEQIPYREGATITQRFYTKAGIYVTSAPIPVTDTIDQSTLYKKSHVNYSWFPPLRNAQVIYNVRDRRNRLLGDFWTDAVGVVVDAGEIDVPGTTTTLTFRGNLHVSFTTVSLTFNTAAIAVFKCQIKVGSYYLRRSIVLTPNVVYGTPNWTTSPSDYFFVLSDVATLSNTASSVTENFTNIEFVTPPIPASGEFTFDFLDSEVRKVSGAILTTGEVTITWQFNQIVCELLEDGTIDSQVQSKTYEAWNTTSYNDNSDFLKIETPIGDGVSGNTFGKLEIYNGSTWEESTEWKIGGAGTASKISQLLANELVAMRKLPIQKMNGTLYGEHTWYHRLSDGSLNYIFLGGTFHSEMNTITGEWFAISRDNTSIFEPPVEDSPHTGGSSGDESTDPDLSGGGGITIPGGGFPTVKGVKEPSLVIGSVFSIADFSGSITDGDTVTSLPIAAIGTDNTIASGDTIKLVNPINNATQTFVVESDVSGTDTSITVTSATADYDFPEGSFIIKDSKAEAAKVTSGGGEWETSVTTKDDTLETYAIAESIIINTDDDAGNGSTEGMVIDENGINTYNASSSTPGVSITQDGLIYLNQSGHPTPAAGLMYQFGDVWYFQGNSDTKVFPLLFPTIELIAFEYNEVWSTGDTKAFWRATSQYDGLEIFRIGYTTGETLGSSTGNNICKLYKNTSATTVQTFTMNASDNNLVGLAGTSISQGDLFYIECTEVRSTPAKGFRIQLYLRKS